MPLTRQLVVVLPVKQLGRRANLVKEKVVSYSLKCCGPAWGRQVKIQDPPILCKLLRCHGYQLTNRSP